jgi:AraC-like DNA-binding protein
MEICYLAEGQQLYRVADHDYLVCGGEVFVTLPDEDHDTGREPTMPGELFWMQVRLRPAATFGLQKSTALRKSLWELPSRHVPAVSNLAREFEEIHRILLRPSDHMTVRLQTGILRVLLSLIDSASTPSLPSTSTSINRAIRYIEDHLDRPLSLPEIADAAALSESWFKALFRREVGMSPGEYVVRRKIRQARQMLRSGQHSVRDVAAAMGFSSSQYFATAYRRVMGASPSTERPTD